jgi:hypothetical protein
MFILGHGGSMSITNNIFRCSIILSYLILVSCSSTPEKIAPQSGEVVAQFPQMVVGDEWVSNTEKGIRIFKVIKVKPDGSFVLEARSQDDQTIFNLYYDNQYRLITQINTTTGSIVRVSSPPRAELNFPIFVGKKWEQEFDSRASDGSIKTMQNTYTVEGYEKIDTKLGSLDAFKIARTYFLKGPKNSTTYRREFWYSPDLKIIVKSISEDKDEMGNPLPFIEIVGHRMNSMALASNLQKGPVAIEDKTIPGNQKEIPVVVTKRTETAAIDQREVSPPKHIINGLGDYYALLIGNNEYKYLPKLKSAVHDVNTISKILETSYGFKVEVLNDAARSEIISAMNKMRRRLNNKDNLLIYYAGHGVLDEGADEGYWLPVDAEPDVETNWIANSFITASIRAINAKHIIIIADSCYAGKLTRGINISDKSNDYLARIAAKRARTVLSSGGLEPVLDSGGKNRHSIFASAFIDALTENKGAIDGTQIFSSIRRPIMLESNQTPEYSDIRNAGHDGGDFIFFRR